ncbi:hypothetical protein JTB14_013122 [Gonioctena quinquepunctata]|nr:hypothetical protein JTB14_013122 [Gonioctena quinquepunctata]
MCQKYDNETSLKATDNRGCYICGSMDHFIRKCPKNTSGRGKGRPGYRGTRSRGYSHHNQQQANNADEKQIETEIQLYAANLCDLKDKLYFVLDSGASNHFVKEDVEEHMTEIKYLSQYVTIQIANGENLKTNKKGTLKLPRSKGVS